ncbi:DUF1439 domain-containing protein [Aliidiomarina indica]|uniref:DUF1439 domain-containing protein n=1 Tax=Aliidiomarina indica TaxID=2749147 RepID=UPI00188E55F3|nr:DUF1439 domain-containing protein [Aliidiomarina indica]
MKKYVLLLCLTLFLFGCAQLSQIASYRVEQGQLEQILWDRINAMDTRVTILGMSAPLEVEKLSLEIGPEDTNLVRVHTAFTLQISGLGMSYPIAVEMSVEGAPIYRHDQHAVFVRNLDILNASIDAGGYRGSLGFLNREVKQILDEIMAEQPVYRLDADNPRHRMLMRFPISMEVESGGLRFRAQQNND